jgi:hypothetical protein
MDVKSASLNNKINELVYIEQLCGFEDSKNWIITMCTSYQKIPMVWSRSLSLTLPNSPRKMAICVSNICWWYHIPDNKIFFSWTTQENYVSFH